MVFDRLYRAPTRVLLANEAVLKQDLFSMRQAIEQYTQDKGKPPQTLDDIISAGYLHAFPKDPFTHKADTWQTTQEDILTPIDVIPPGVTDVKSGSSLISTDGTAYSSW
jgi:general secretion pathway protein G